MTLAYLVSTHLTHNNTLVGTKHFEIFIRSKWLFMGILSQNASDFENMINVQACVAMTTGMIEIGCLR